MYSTNYTNNKKSVDMYCNKNYIMIGHCSNEQLSVDCLVEPFKMAAYRLLCIDTRVPNRNIGK